MRNPDLRVFKISYNVWLSMRGSRFSLLKFKVHGVMKSRMTDDDLHFHFSLSCIGEGNGTPLQCSCLENPRYGGAWWAAVYGLAKSRTRLKRLSSSRDFSSKNGGISGVKMQTPKQVPKNPQIG